MSSKDTDLMLQKNENVELVVGGLRYTCATADLRKHPDSFFGALLKREWRSDKTTPITIDRDGCIFRFVFAFLVTGQLPRHQDRTIALDDATLSALHAEADFFNLSALIKECEANPSSAQVLGNLGAYASIRNHISRVKSTYSWVPQLSCEYSSTKSNALVNVLASVWAPFCETGQLYARKPSKLPIFKSSNFGQLNIEELLAEAQQSAFGKGLETVTDTAEVCPHELRPYKLVIYQEGGHFDQHRDTVRGDNHIGTLVLILNSKYTGGELEISHGGKTEVVTGPYNWVEMYGDCLHKINPVTSGTRVSLIYDDQEGAENDNEEEEKVDEDEYYDSDFSEDERPERLSDRVRGGDWRESGAANPQLQHSIYAALDRELLSFDTVVICLTHLYPYCQVKPSFLKGGDQSLYELLQDKYEVSVEAVSMCMIRDPNRRSEELKAFMLRDMEAGSADAGKGHCCGHNTKFVIPSNMDSDSVLDYSPYIEHTGNESQQEATVYVVSGLQVRRK